GRRPHESGPHGCTLVQVDDRIRTTFIPTDAVRYYNEHVSPGATTSLDELYHLLEERTVELLADPFGPDLLVKWIISPNESLARGLRRGTATTDLVARLRTQFANRRPAAWTTAIEVAHEPSIPRERYAEETLLGEFLRTVQHYTEHADAPLDLQPLLAERFVA